MRLKSGDCWDHSQACPQGLAGVSLLLGMHTGRHRHFGGPSPQRPLGAASLGSTVCLSVHDREVGDAQSLSPLPLATRMET